MTPGQRFLSIRETADLLGVSRGVIERRKAELGAVAVSPRLYRIPIEGLELWLRLHRVRRPNARQTGDTFSLISRARREASR